MPATHPSDSRLRTHEAQVRPETGQEPLRQVVRVRAQVGHTAPHFVFQWGQQISWDLGVCPRPPTNRENRAGLISCPSFCPPRRHRSLEATQLKTPSATAGPPYTCQGSDLGLRRPCGFLKTPGHWLEMGRFCGPIISSN